MNNNRPLVILACVILAAVSGMLWYLNTRTPVPVSTTQPADIDGRIGPTINPPPALKDSITPPWVANAPHPVQPWEQQIENIVNSNPSETKAGQLLIDLLPTLPLEGQKEAALNITNLIVDEQYSRILPLLKNASLPEEVLDVFVSDITNRDDPIRLPGLLEIAKIPEHPFQEEALTNLELFMDGNNYGTNWEQWDAAVKKYLLKQAAEDAEIPAALPAIPKK